MPRICRREIQADRLLLQAEREIGEESFVEAFATLDRILALQAEHGLEIPVAFWFKRAHVAHEGRAANGGREVGQSPHGGG